jgi:multidrug efflux pump subunit AcrA (membrane-fusion protein)
VIKGQFVADINVTGELEARNSVKILGPTKARQYRIYQMKLQNIIPEGTKVKKGQFVASLDPSELARIIKDKQVELEGAESKYLTTKLDTALTMRQIRDELINLKYAVEEKELVLEQSKYEPPATIKKSEIDLEKAKRAYNQKKESYEIKKRQSEAKIIQARVSMEKVQRDLEGMNELMKEFTILAPEDGMLIYAKSWNGQQIKAGSQIEVWNPTVASLPDLSSMNSKTYVNEVDIRRVKVGQKVDIGLDALPDVQLTGVVARVANSGQKRPNSDSKVFEVMVELDNVIKEIKPGMTTSNKIYTSVIEESLMIPLECLNNHQDSITYVFLKDGGSYKKQEIQIGETNENMAQVLMGLSESDRLYLTPPADSEEDEIALLAELNGKRNTKEEPKPEAKDENPKQFPRKPNS